MDFRSRENIVQVFERKRSVEHDCWKNTFECTTGIVINEQAEQDKTAFWQWLVRRYPEYTHSSGRYS